MRFLHLRGALLSSSLAIIGLASAQGPFQVNGRLKAEGSDLSGARAVVYKDGVKERVITTGLNKFSLELALNANYIIAFEKDGYVAKKLSFNTRVPGDAASKGFTPFDFAVSLFKQYDDVNVVVFNQPVGIIRYDPAVGDFDYDTDYTKSIQSQLQEAAAQVERKQKQESQAAAEAEKRKAEEAKAQARADAEARRQAAAQQAAEAKAKADADRQAEAERLASERARAEAAKRDEAREESMRREAAKPAVPATKPDPPRRTAPMAARSEEKEPKAPPAARRSGPRAPMPVTGEDGRRALEPILAEEPSRMAVARMNTAEEERPAVAPDVHETLRNEDLIVEAAKVTTVVRLETNGIVTEYRRVSHKWGGIFYFKDGQACSQLVYEREALAQDQLAGASPRGKLD